MLSHGSSPRNQGAKPAPQPLTCSCNCSEAIGGISELCFVCRSEYEAWLANQAAATRAETIYVSAAQFFAALDLFEDATTAAVLTVRTVIAERAA